MHVLDILAFWKSTADSFQHNFFVTLWSFHQERRRNKISSASLFVSGEHVLANFFSATFSIFYRKGILTTIVRKGAQEEKRMRRSTLEGVGIDDIIVSWWHGFRRCNVS